MRMMNAAIEEGQNVARAYQAAAVRRDLSIVMLICVLTVASPHANSLRACPLFLLQEADTMTVMNVQSSSKGLDDFLYFIVPAAWYRKAWCLLLKPGVDIPEDWRERIGELEPVRPWWEGAGQADDDPVAQQKATVMNEMRSAWKNPASYSAASNRAQKIHGKDYYFVGQNAWGVLENKFGKAAADGVSCHIVSLPSQDSCLSVNVPDGNRVPIPGSGRFAYEASLEKEDNGDENDADRAVEDQVRLYAWMRKKRCPFIPKPGTHFISTRSSLKQNVANTVEDEDEPMNAESNAQEGPILLSSAPQSPRRDDPPGVQSTPSLRDYGAGLANLGNTCFMSATIQCLGHTHQILQYFLSGSFMDDLNRDNPLGTGGVLAVEFAKLLREIWVDNSQTSSSRLYGPPNHIVYPRCFKSTVGRFAEQFSGYDQHDTQEFATYLLDALHEDTNRISKKPYIEKPEQGENETDQEAADKAWDLHLQRENSRVLEQFMGQVKSRVKCCEEKCGRVSTTFDPIMYLSVPIPGSSDRQIKTIFVPLDPDKRPVKLSLMVPKAGSIVDLIQKCQERLVALGMDSEKILLEDLVAVDVWNREIYAWYENTQDVDRIRDTDETYIYQLRPLNEIRRLSVAPPSNMESEDALESTELASSGRKHQLDIATLSRLNSGDTWSKDFAHYLRNHMLFLNTFNPTKGTTEGRLKFLNKLKAFLEKCHEIIEGEEGNGSQSDDASAQRRHGFMRVLSEEHVQAIVELSEDSAEFENVTSAYDVAVLEFCAGKLREEILNIIQSKKKKNLPDGAVIQVRSKCYSSFASSRDTCLAGPLVLRIPSNMTVYELREELAHRMRRSIRTGRQASSSSAGEATSEMDAQRATGLLSPLGQPPSEANGFDNAFGPPGLLKLRQVPMYYERCKQNGSSYGVTRYPNVTTQLGGLAKPGAAMPEKRSSPLVSPSEDEEKEEVAQCVGEKGTVVLDWPGDLADECFDTIEFHTTEEPQEDSDIVNAHKTKEVTTVLDCIEKYCQEEQLEETEMWYCNKCKKHVRAWKQFHLYRAPPILLIHLKRFQYSATTHRRDKLSQFIDFPLEGLDLTKHFATWKDGEEPVYDCYGVSNHFGGLGGGHYTAHALHNNGVWCYYDDTRITSDVDPKEAITNAAYVLYYRRRDVSTGTEFSISTETPEAHRSPAIILENSDRMNGHFEQPGSSAALIGDEDNMDIDNDAASRSTSPMSEGHDDDIIRNTFSGDNALPGDQDELPRQ